MLPQSAPAAGGGLSVRRWSAFTLGLALAAALALALVAHFVRPGWLDSFPGDIIPLPPIEAGKVAAPKVVAAIPSPGHTAHGHGQRLGPASAPRPSRGGGAVPTASGLSGSNGAVGAASPSPAPSGHQPGNDVVDETAGSSPAAAPAPMPSSAPAPAPSPAPASSSKSNPAPAASPSSAPKAVSSSHGHGNGNSNTNSNGKSHGVGAGAAHATASASYPSSPPAAAEDADPGQEGEPPGPPSERGNGFAYGHAHGHSGE